MPSNAVVRGELDLNSRKFEAGISRAQQQIKSLETTARRLGTLSFFAGGAAVVSVTRTIVDFQKEMARTGALVDANSGEFAALTDKARELGSTTLFSAKEAASGFAFLAQAGFEANAIIESSEDFLNLAAAASLDLATTMDIASNIMQGFGLEAESSGRAVDVLSNVSKSSNTNVLDLGEAMKQIGPVAAAGSVEIESAAAAVGLLANAGIKGSLSGTSLRNIILRLSDPTSEAKKAIAALGLTINELNPATNSLVDIFGRIKSGMDGASDSAMALGAASDIFGLRAAASGLVLSSNVEGLKELTESNKESEGTTKRLADRIQDNLGGALQILRSRLDELKLTISDGGFGEAMRLAADEASAALDVFIASGSAEEFGQNLAEGLKAVVKVFERLASVVMSAASTFKENKELFIGMAKAAGGLYAGIKAIQLAAFIADLGKTAAGLASSTAGFFSNTAAITANTAAHRANSAASTMSMAQATRQMERLEFLGAKTQKSYKKSGKAAASFWKLANPAGLAAGGAYGLLAAAVVTAAAVIIKETKGIKEAEEEMEKVSESSRKLQSNLKDSRVSRKAKDKEGIQLAYLKLLKDEATLKRSIREGDETSPEGKRLQEAQLKAVGAELDKIEEKRESEGRKEKKRLEGEKRIRKEINALIDSVPFANRLHVEQEITEEILRQRKALESSPSLNQESQIAALEKRKAALEELRGMQSQLRKESKKSLGLGSQLADELEDFFRMAEARSKRGDLLGFESSGLYAVKLAEVAKRISAVKPNWNVEGAVRNATSLLGLAKDIHVLGTSSQLVSPEDEIRAARVRDIMKSMGDSGDRGSRKALAEDLLKIERKRSELSEEDAAKRQEEEEAAQRAAQDKLKLLRAQAGLGGDAEAIKRSQEEAKLALQIQEAQNIGAQQAFAQAKETLQLERDITKQKEAQKEADNIAKKTAEIAQKAIRQQISDVSAMINELDRRADDLPNEIRDNNNNRGIKGAARNDVRRAQQAEMTKLQDQASVAAKRLKQLKNSTSGTNEEIKRAERELKNFQSSLAEAAGKSKKSKTGGTSVQGNRASVTGRAVGKGKLVGGEGAKVAEARRDLIKAQRKDLAESRKESEAQAAAEKAALQSKQEKEAEMRAKETAAREQRDKREKTQKKGAQAANEVSVNVGSDSNTSAFTELSKSICACIEKLGVTITGSDASKRTITAADDIAKIREHFDELSIS